MPTGNGTRITPTQHQILAREGPDLARLRGGGTQMGSADRLDAEFFSSPCQLLANLGGGVQHLEQASRRVSVGRPTGPPRASRAALPRSWPEAERVNLKRIQCDEVLEQLSEYIDEETRAELCEAIQEHLSRCHDCQVMVDSVKKTIILYQSGASTEVPTSASARLSAALAREYGPGRDPRHSG